MIIRLPGCYPIVCSANTSHWKPNGTHHGPRSNPALVHLNLVYLGSSPRFEGWRLWVYFRKGHAWMTDVYIDKRDPVAPPTRETELESALSLAVAMLAQHEPPDSRAVSDEFVALATVVSKIDDAASWRVIHRANAHIAVAQDVPVMTYSVGDKIKFTGERLRYTVRAASNRFLVCTKPFNPRKTVLYSIVDLEQNIRGRENLIFGMGFETDEQCQAALARLESGETEVSHRHCVSLLIDAVS